MEHGPSEDGQDEELSEDVFQNEEDFKQWMNNADWAQNLQNRRALHLGSRDTPLLTLLPPDQLAVITLHAVLGCMFQRPDGVRISKVAAEIGLAIEAQVMFYLRSQVLADLEAALDGKMTKKKKFLNLAADCDDPEEIRIRKKVRSVFQQYQRIVAKRINKTNSELGIEWDSVLAEPGGVDLSTITRWGFKWSKVGKLPRVVSHVIALAKKDPLLVDTELGRHWPSPLRCALGCRLIAILLETAKTKNGLNAFSHGYEVQRQGKKIAEVGVLRGNPDVRQWLQGGHLSDILLQPQYAPMLVPPNPWTSWCKGGYLQLYVSMMRTHGSHHQLEALLEHSDTMSPIYEALSVLGQTKWKINKPVLEAINKAWELGGDIAGIPKRYDVEIPALPEAVPSPGMDATDEELKEYDVAVKNQARDWSRLVFKAKKLNRELVGLRAAHSYQVHIAMELKDDEFYFPHNLDFRGRAYPVPAHLNHLGNDCCRGMLMFAEAKPLGPRGLLWLKRHLASLCGVDKVTWAQREAWVDERLDSIHKAASDPFSCKDIWLKADDPWQALATIIEISNAIKSGNPETYACALPVHQDGSCNGLQHYAALGRDLRGAEQVNLVPGEKPSDPYSGVAGILARKVEDEAAQGDEIALLLRGKISRKIVKQTVMTSVYGVTYVGARQQIENRLDDLEGDDALPEDTAWKCSAYLTKATLHALEESFVGARQVMGWLADVAAVVARHGSAVDWVTPLGLPVVQPYRTPRMHRIRTLVQTLQLSESDDVLPIIKRKQSTAFPPNYIHSIDSSHLMLTAISCNKAGITFAGVHDSFWTHACDVDKMSTVLRDQFIHLHSMPLLESLVEHLEDKFPAVKGKLPPIPKRGDLDLNIVRNSDFFFA